MKQCSICNKGSLMAGKNKKIKSAYDPVDWKRKYPNLQKTRSANGTRIVACTSCIKRMAMSKKSK